MNFILFSRIFQYFLLLLFIYSEAKICELNYPCSQTTDTLNCAFVGLECIPSFGNAKIISLHHNKISLLSVSDFPDSIYLNKLDLGANKISKIEDKTFELIDIANIILNYNYISDLTKYTFAGLSNLTSLDLGFNSIKTIHSNAFETLINLKELILERNPISNLSSSLFFFNNQLQRISLKQTNIKSINYDIFASISLNYLNLENNHFQKIPSDMLNYNPTLEIFDFDENPITIIESKTFESMKYLKKLYLKNMAQLKSIYADAFNGLISLQLLDLSHNRNLKFIHRFAFRGINGDNTNLTVVILRDNQLTSVDFQLLPWKSIPFIDLEDNPIICDCNIVWFLKITWNEEQTLDLLCDRPPQLHGMRLIEVSEENLQCTAAQLIKASTIIIIVGITLCAILVVGFLIILYRKKCVEVVNAHKQIQYSKIDDTVGHGNSEWITTNSEKKLHSAVDL